MMSRQSICKKIRKLLQDTSGQIAMTTAILMPVLLISAGIALDYSRISNARTSLFAALDAAILAAGRDMVDGVAVDDQFEINFKNFFLANMTGSGVDPEKIEFSDFNADEDTGEVSATVNMELEMSLMRIAGYDTVDVEASSKAAFPIEPVEVAIMLDTTGSMEGQKLQDLKVAARNLVEALLPERRTRGMRVAIVPYAGSVNLGKKSLRDRVSVSTVNVASLESAIASDAISRIDQHGADNSCVTDRGGRFADTDAGPRDAPVGSDVRTARIAGLECPSAAVQPLTNDRGALFQTIDSLEASGWTAGHLGVAWSYYTLSENWRNIWGGNSKPDAYSSDTRKIAVLMTDGEFNTFYSGTSDPGDPDNVWSAVGNDKIDKSNQLAEDLCTDMKRPKANGRGITVYSVAFQAPASAEATLRRCATPDTPAQTFYFSAQSGQELKEAFEEIEASIGRLRITR